MGDIIRLVAKRLLYGLGTLWVVSVLIFGAVELLPGDLAEAVLGQGATEETVAAMREELGLDRPVWVRYGEWLKGAVQGDFGESLVSGERVSKAMGDALSVMHSLGLSTGNDEVTGNLSIGKDPVFTPYELMSLPADEQIIHVSGVGFIHARKIRQNEIAPYCFDLAPNRLEGGRLPPDPKVTLTV